MNIAPHTHRFEIRQKNNHKNILIITYGDQTKHVNTRYPGWRSRLKKKTLKIVEKHDKASRLAYLSPEAVSADLQQKYNDLVLVTPERSYYPQERKDAWGSDLIKAEKVTAE